MKSENKVWFITGISRGLGKALALEALSRGDVVIGTSRNGKVDYEAPASTGGKLHTYKLDVSDEESVYYVVNQAQELYGRLDVVVNNAGYGLLGPVESTSAQETQELFNTNFFGTLYVIQATLPHLRAQGEGHIINISSIAGLAPRAGYAMYAASKSAVEGLSKGLAAEVGPLGIKVTVVEPGAFRTDFLNENSIKHTAQNMEEYDSTSGAMLKLFADHKGKQIGDPARGAKAMVDMVYSDEPPLHFLLGSDAVARTQAMLGEMTAELAKWESVAVSTDYEKVPVG